MNKVSLEVEGLVAGYGEVEVLHGVSLYAEPQKITCIIGPNGGGKSTLLKAIFGMIKPTQGKVILDGENVTGMRPDLLLRKGICYLLQGRSVFPYMSVWENLEMGVYIRNDNEQIREDIDVILKLFPVLDEKKDEMARTLSGGQQRMLELARSLLLKPRIILLDEPSLGLAPIFYDIVFEQIEKMKEMKITILTVEQQARKILSISDYGYVLDLGNVVMNEKCENLLKTDKLVKLYLGD